jgi:hypothetical protein
MSMTRKDTVSRIKTYATHALHFLGASSIYVPRNRLTKDSPIRRKLREFAEHHVPDAYADNLMEDLMLIPGSTGADGAWVAIGPLRGRDERRHHQNEVGILAVATFRTFRLENLSAMDVGEHKSLSEFFVDGVRDALEKERVGELRLVLARSPTSQVHPLDDRTIAEQRPVRMV